MMRKEITIQSLYNGTRPQDATVLTKRSIAYIICPNF